MKQVSNQKPNKNIKKKKQKFDDYIKYSSLAFQMVAIIFAGVFGGYKIDTIVNWDFPVFIVFLSLAGVCIAVYVAIKDFVNFK